MDEMSRARGFAITDYELDLQFYDSITYEYLILGRERCPDTGREHWQGFIYFKNARSLNATIKLLKPRHCEPCRGSAEQNIKYCSKDGELVIEKGEKPQQGKRSDLERACVTLKDNGIKAVAEEHPSLYVRYHKGFKALQEQLITHPKRSWKSTVHVLWGPAGAGKTHKAINAGATPLSWDQNKNFILDYENQEKVLIDDFDPKDWNRAYILRLLDKWPMTVNIKNGSKEWNPKEIWITSNIDPKTWLGGDIALQRRLDVVEKITQRFDTEVCEGNTIPRMDNLYIEEKFELTDDELDKLIC